AKPVMLSAIKRGWRGDPLEERPLLSRLGLHADGLTIPGLSAQSCTGGENETGENDPADLVLKAPLPRDMAALIRQMEKAAGREFDVK
ncbi:MAG: hypothetical protein FWH38_06190, partial [Treponema sp.]|nr:hypothetical protein [Treponema sp.]